MAQTPDRDSVLQCEDQRYEAMVQGDVSRLNDILADDFTYTHSNGQLDSKEQFLALLTSGQLRYLSIGPEESHVRIYRTAGIVTGIGSAHAQLRGQELQFRYRYTAVYVRERDRWQLAAWQSTHLP